MAYSTKAEIESEFKNMTFEVDTNVSASDVGGFIAEADSLIDTYVGVKYVVPVSSSDSPISFNTLKLCSRTLVAARVRAIMAVKQASNTDANHEVRGAVGFNTSNVMALLKDIRDGKQNLADGILVEAAGGFSSYNVDNKIEPVFKKDVKQW